MAAETGETAETRVLEAEIRALKAIIEVERRRSEDERRRSEELREERDRWHEQAKRLALPKPESEPTKAPTGSVPSIAARRSWWPWRKSA